GGGLRELLKLIMSVALPLLQLGSGIALSAGLGPEFESLARMPQPEQRGSAEEPGQSEIGLEAQGALEAAKRLSVMMEIIELDHAQLEMGLGIVGAREGLAPPELPISAVLGGDGFGGAGQAKVMDAAAGLAQLHPSFLDARAHAFMDAADEVELGAAAEEADVFVLDPGGELSAWFPFSVVGGGCTIPDMGIEGADIIADRHLEGIKAGFELAATDGHGAGFEAFIGIEDEHPIGLDGFQCAVAGGSKVVFPGNLDHARAMGLGDRDGVVF